MTFTSTILPPIHLLLYSTLLGTQLYQSFIVTKITHRALPISSFTTLQKKLFPAYFRTTALLALGTIVAWPHWKTGDAFRGRLAWKEGRGWEVALLGTMVVMVGINWGWLGEAVRGVMVERVHQGEMLIFPSHVFSSSLFILYVPKRY
jgi:hypothetical protein